MASTNSSTVQNIVVLRVGATLPTSAAVMDDHDLISAIEEKHEFILQDRKYVCKITLVVDAVVAGIDMAVETAKSLTKVKPTDDGGLVVKVESSYTLPPVRPSVERAQDDEVAETNEMTIAEINEVGGAANFKVKLD